LEASAERLFSFSILCKPIAITGIMADGFDLPDFLYHGE